MSKITSSLKFNMGFELMRKEFFQLLLLLVASVFALYFIPVPYNKYVFLFLIPLLIRSNKAYFWFGYLLLVLDQPGGLFFGGSADDPLRFPLFTLFSGLSFGLDELILIILFIKAYRVRKKKKINHPLFKSWLSIFGLLFVLLVFISPSMGMGLESIRYLKKAIIYLSTFYTLLYGVTRIELEKLLVILIPFTVFAVFFQLFSLANQYQFIHLIRSDIQSVQGEFSKLKGIEIVERPIEMTTILLLNFVSTLYFLKQKFKPFTSRFLMLINLLSFVAILMTATRSWFIAFVFAYLLYFLFFTKIISFKSIYNSTIILIAALVLLVAVPAVRDQLDSAFTRLSTITAVAKGDITAKGTLKRYDVRAPKVMEGISKSTVIFGAAFSDLYMEYDDFHVGYHNMFLNIGLVGYLLILIFSYKVIELLYRLRIYAASWGVPLIGLLMLLIINTGSQMIGYNVSLASRYMLQSIVSVFLVNSVTYAFNLDRVKKSA